MIEFLTIVILSIVAFVEGALGLVLVWKAWKGDFDVSQLICEKTPTGAASMSRFQLLIFTFVISLSLFYLVIRNGQFPQVSPEVLTLLGISGGTYVISKGLTQSGSAPSPDAGKPDEAGGSS